MRLQKTSLLLIQPTRLQLDGCDGWHVGAPAEAVHGEGLRHFCQSVAKMCVEAAGLQRRYTTSTRPGAKSLFLRAVLHDTEQGLLLSEAQHRGRARPARTGPGSLTNGTSLRGEEV